MRAISDTVIVALGGIVVSTLAYFAGQQRAAMHHREERQRIDDRSRQERQRALAEKMIDEFVGTVRRHYADGPYALAPLGLEALGSDAAIRDAISEMEVRSASDPWSGQRQHVEGVDLVAFFRYVREHRVNFAKTTVEEVARHARCESHPDAHP